MCEKKKSQKGAMLPEYISLRNLALFISDDVREKLLQPITYISKAGKVVQGISANLLPEICSIWLKAREKSALSEKQKLNAQKAEILFLGYLPLATPHARQDGGGVSII